MLPAMKPPSMRETSSHQMLLAKPSIRYETHAPARLVIRIGRRPWRSLRLPQNGAATNWHSEYAPMMGVIHWGGALKRTPIYGTNGIRIPKPRMSMTLTMNREPSRAFIKNGASMIRNQLPDVGTRPRGSRQEVTRPADDEVGNAPIIPVGRELTTGTQYGDLQRRHQPQPVATAVDHEHVARCVR